MTLKRYIKLAYHNSFIRYSAVGGTSFLLDFGLLVGLHGRLHVDLSLATSIAYWLPNIYNFLLSRYWTFSVAQRDSMYKHIGLYGALLIFDYLFTVAFIDIFNRPLTYWFAKIASVAIQIIWSYPLYKYVIFAEKKPNKKATGKSVPENIVN